MNYTNLKKEIENEMQGEKDIKNDIKYQNAMKELGITINYKEVSKE